MARDRNQVKAGPNQSNLAALTQNHLCYPLPKPSYMRRGETVSALVELVPEVKLYCPKYAEAPLRLHHKLK